MGFLLPLPAGVVLPLELRYDHGPRVYYISDSVLLPLGVPTKDSLLTQTDDIGKYLYLCLENRRCAICNQPAEVHHVDRVGMGRDREAIVHVGLNAIALCRRHHEEAHRREKALFADYHIYGIELDRHLCKVLSLNQKPKGEVERGRK